MKDTEHLERLLRPKFRLRGWRRLTSAADAVEMVVSAYESGLPSPHAVERDERRDGRRFEKPLRRRYRRAFRRASACIEACSESVINLLPVLAHHEQAIGELGAAFELQHAQAVRASRECLLLLRSGFGSGALVHARTVMEIAVSVLVLAGEFEKDPTNSLAKRYFDHEAVVRAGQAQSHDELAELLGDSEYRPENNEAARQVLEKYRRELGDEVFQQFRKEWGWLSGVVCKGRPNTQQVMAYVSREGWYNYFRYASDMTHGSTRGAVLNRVDFRGKQIPLYGPTNVFLTDPAQLMLMHLAVISSSIVACTCRVTARFEEFEDEDEDDVDDDVDDDELLLDRRLRQMQSLAMSEYVGRVLPRAVDEFWETEQHIEMLEATLGHPLQRLVQRVKRVALRVGRLPGA